MKKIKLIPHPDRELVNGKPTIWFAEHGANLLSHILEGRNCVLDMHLDYVKEVAAAHGWKVTLKYPKTPKQIMGLARRGSASDFSDLLP